jgi:hypothetical protein
MMRIGMDKPYELPPGKGNLFTNKKKEENGDKHDWFGTIRIQVKDRKEPELK